jgi:hypothetical protein
VSCSSSQSFASGFAHLSISCIGAASLSLTYGLPVSRINDPFIQTVAASFRDTAAASSPGKYLVNVIPILKYVPEWMPGATFKREARELRDLLNQVKEIPFKKVLKAMVSALLFY